MANNLELIQEAKRRGLQIPSDKEALYNEAVSRGLIKDTSARSKIADFTPPERTVQTPKWMEENPNLAGVAGAGKALIH